VRRDVSLSKETWEKRRVSVKRDMGKETCVCQKRPVKPDVCLSNYTCEEGRVSVNREITRKKDYLKRDEDIRKET